MKFYEFLIFYQCFYSKAPFNEEVNEIKMIDSNPNYCWFDENSTASENEYSINMSINNFVRNENQNEFDSRYFQFSPTLDHSDIDSQIKACEKIKPSKKYLIFQKSPEKIEVFFRFNFLSNKLVFFSKGSNT